MGAYIFGESSSRSRSCSGSRSSGSSPSSSRPVTRCSSPRTRRSWRTSLAHPEILEARAPSPRLRPADLPQPVPATGWAASSRATSGYSVTSTRLDRLRDRLADPADAVADGRGAHDGRRHRHPDRRHHGREAVLEDRLRPERGWRSSWPRRRCSCWGSSSIYVFAVNLHCCPRAASTRPGGPTPVDASIT